MFEQSFYKLKRYFIEHTGLAYYADKDFALNQAFNEILASNALATQTDLWLAMHAPGGSKLLNQLIQMLTIGETYFFRHQEQYDALATQILPALLQAAHQPLRIWSAGCATGEEAYSLVLLFAEYFPQVLLNQGVEIFASDLNPAFIERAQRALYRDWSFRQTRPGFREAYFESLNGDWRLKDVYQKRVQFFTHNLLSGPLAAAPFDLIVCRNVLIYFNAVQQQKLVKSFYNQLNPRGWLMLGPAELTPLRCHPFYAPELARLSCFLKTPAPAPLLPDFSPSHLKPKPLDPVLILPDRRVQKPPKAVSVADLKHQTLQTSKPLSVLQEEVRTSTLQQIQRFTNAGEFNEAIGLCQHLQAQNPLDARALYWLGVIRSAQGETETALALFKQVLYLNRKDLLSHFRVALIRLQLGQEKAAQRALRNARNLLKPDSAGLATQISLDIDDIQALIEQQEAQFGS